VDDTPHTGIQKAKKPVGYSSFRTLSGRIKR
jgi:hypothetical protein